MSAIAGALGTAAKESRGVAGWFRTADGKMKWGRVAAAGGAGVATWALVDKNAGAKIGDSAGKIGGAVGSGVGGLGAGLGSGLISQFLKPEYIFGSAISCVCCCMVMSGFFLMKQ